MSFLQEGGQLYTWGGAFEATASISLPQTPRLPSQKDDHHGCLGHGDKVGKLKPIRCKTWLLVASKEHLRVPSHSLLFRSALGYDLLAEAAHYSVSQKDMRWKGLGTLQLWGEKRINF